MHFPFYKVMGVKVQPLIIGHLNEIVEDSIKQRRKVVIANHNLHSVYLYYHDEKMKRYYEEYAHFIHIDGMPLVWWGRLLGYPLKREHRVGYLDWMPSLLNLSVEREWRIYHLGGKPGVAQRGYAILEESYGKLNVRTHHGYFDMHNEENENVIADINAFNPHILLVGMGMPRQEHWIVNNYKRLSTNVILQAGGYIDYIAGEQVYVPRWIGYIGIEWLFRLITHPRRLWRRYLVEPWSLVGVMLRDLRKKLSKFS